MPGLSHWIYGTLSPAERIWGSLLPALLLVAYFVLGLIPYAARCALRGPYRDAEIESRGSSVLVGMWARHYFVWVMRPLWALLLRSGIPSTAVTTLSLLLSIGSGVSFSVGRFALGGWLYIFAGICDFLDGRLARASGQARPSGAALDSILDRYNEAAVLIGLLWFYRETWVLLPVALAMLGSSLVPYIRARGEALGVNDMRIGVMQRPERVVYLGACTALSPIAEAWLDPANPHPLHRVAVLGVVLLAISTQLTALHRFLFLLRALGERPLASWSGVGRDSLFRNVLAAFVATVADLGLVMVLVSWYGLVPWLATGIGCDLGAVINFSINHRWTFANTSSSAGQMARYSLVSLTSALLNSGGVAVLMLLPDIDYRICWVLVRAAVFLAWNYPLHREYVFVLRGDPESKQARA